MDLSERDVDDLLSRTQREIDALTDVRGSPRCCWFAFPNQPPTTPSPPPHSTETQSSEQRRQAARASQQCRRLEAYAGVALVFFSRASLIDIRRLQVL